MIRNIIFDWSGTLVDDLPGVWKATNHVLEQAGAPTLTLDEFRSDFELPFTNFYDRHIPDDPPRSPPNVSVVERAAKAPKAGSFCPSSLYKTHILLSRPASASRAVC